MNDFIMQMRPWFGVEEQTALYDYMGSDVFVTEFKKTEQFESMLADFTGARQCVVVNNGTISLTLAALVAGIGPGDEVIVPNYTMIATPNSVKMLGAEPVFVDVEAATLCLDIEKVRKAITPKTKAIMLVSANGRFPLAGIEAFTSLAKQQGLFLIEDAAQSLGSYYPDGRHIGLAGDVGSFSFSAPKIISTGQGGCLVTNDEGLAARIRKMKDFGRESGGSDIHDEIGYNFKFTDIQACIGIEQMKKLRDRIVRKKEIASLYQKLLKDTPQVRLFDHDFRFTCPWFIDALVEDRENLKRHLKEKGVGSRDMYSPINQQKAYQKPGSYPVSEKVGRDGLWLPSYTQLTDAEISRVCDAVSQFYGTRI
ncbi:MAG: DegT/DnrJ/EryC1/StrS family aminotransferase [Pseudomonadales bacterium]|nr:DegT/DnrJ/EryC1/StrS family aminotransferase [Pseudomonadales bacterium]